MVRRSKKKSRFFEAFVGLCILGGISWPYIAKNLHGKLYLIAGLAVLAVLFAVVAGVALSRRRKPTFLESIGHRQDRIEPSGSTTQEFWSASELDEPSSWKAWWDRRARREPAIDRSAWSLELLRAIEWHRIEQVAAAYFRLLGFQAQLTDFGPDGGVDIKLFHGHSMRPAILVQCKAWKSWDVGVKHLRELYGVMGAEGVKEGIFLTTARFTPNAKEFARKVGIHLIDGRDFLDKISKLLPEQSAQLLAMATEGDFTTPTCPACGVKMVERKGEGKRFWGCRHYPSCRQKIFSDPDAAYESA